MATDFEDEKKLAAEAAAELLEDGMTVGLGTGSTVAYFLPALARRNLSLRCVATSPRTEEAARALVGAVGARWTRLEVQLTDPVRVWMGAGSLDLYQQLERGMWPDRAGDLHAVNRYNLTHSDLMTPAQVARAWMRRRRLEAEVAALHDEVDVVLTPTTAVPPFAAEGPIPEVIAGQSVFPAMAVPFTMVANLCWNPAVSVPAGLTAAGLPVGLQIQGPRHADEVVLRLARVLEQARPWPPLPVV